MNEEMKVIVLAAGFSTRLGELTKKVPKGLLKIGSKPIISYLLEKVVNISTLSGISLVVNAANASNFEEFIETTYQNITIVNNGIYDSEHRLGAIKDLLFVLDKVGYEHDVLVLPSDTLVDIDMDELIRFYKEHRGFVNVVREEDPNAIQGQLGCVEVDEFGKIVSFEEKPEEPKDKYASVPIYIYPKEILHLIREYAETPGENLDSPGAIVPWLLERLKDDDMKLLGMEAFGYIVEGYYYDVGTPKMLKKLQENPEEHLGKK